MKSRTGYFVYKYVVSDEIIYVGIALDIVRRIHDHRRCSGLDKKFAPYINKAEIYVHECAKESEMRALETLLIDFYKPVLNEAGKTDIPSSLSPAGNLLSWELYDEKEYIEQKLSRQSEGGAKKPYRPRYSKSRIREARALKRQLLKVIDIVKAFPSILEESAVPDPLGSIRVYGDRMTLWSAYEHLPLAVCRGKTEHDVNLAFVQANLDPILYRTKNASGVYQICYGIITLTSAQGCERAFIRIDTNKISEMLQDADRFIAYYDEILQYDTDQDGDLDTKDCEEDYRIHLEPWDGDNDLLKELSWENIKDFVQCPVENVGNKVS